MKILLVGEYSRLHNSLKEGLTALGHQVVIVGTGDNFKKYSTDYSIHPALFTDYYLLRKLKNAIYKFTGFDLSETEKGLKFYALLPKLKGFDHVQLINSDAVETHPWLERLLYKKLLKQNCKISLLVCGDESPVIDYCLNGDLKYNILTPYLKDKGLKDYFRYSLKYTKPNYRKLFALLQKHSSVIITSDLDYEIPMNRSGYTTHFIPNPINTDTIDFIPTEIQDKIVVFLGINRLSYIKKGISFFESALETIRKKYPEKVEIIITENMPYGEYIKMYNRAHILLDQVYAYDQGYNALEAMAKGKVVFTGAEQEFTEHYNLTERVAINALPDAEAIVRELSYLIENPYEIIATGKRARAFVEKKHNYITIAGKYLETWSK